MMTPFLGQDSLISVGRVEGLREMKVVVLGGLGEEVAG